jgi:hypothetical protein
MIPYNQTQQPNMLILLLKLHRLLLIIIVGSIIILIVSLIIILYKIIYNFIKVILSYRIKKHHDYKNDECCICLEPINSTNITTTYCNHTFHNDCIKNLYNYNNKCPLCRRTI